MTNRGKQIGFQGVSDTLWFRYPNPIVQVLSIRELYSSVHIAGISV